jgi:amino acid transporter
MLGVTGFETAANYVEECKTGVFQKILRNLWWTVFLINPLMSIITLGVLDLNTVKAHPNSVLAALATTAGGTTFGNWIAFDAFFVLSGVKVRVVLSFAACIATLSFMLFLGAVLTAFVGVNGLVRRLALDRSLPTFLLETNALRGTNHWIALVFFALCTSLLLILKGEVGSLANVYSLSFLLVMALFAFGCMMLKFKRSDLKRDVRATWTQVFFPSDIFEPVF